MANQAGFKQICTDTHDRCRHERTKTNLELIQNKNFFSKTKKIVSSVFSIKLHHKHKMCKNVQLQKISQLPARPSCTKCAKMCKNVQLSGNAKCAKMCKMCNLHISPPCCRWARPPQAVSFPF